MEFLSLLECSAITNYLKGVAYARCLNTLLANSIFIEDFKVQSATKCIFKKCDCSGYFWHSLLKASAGRDGNI